MRIVAVIALAVLAAGCGREAGPEQKQADAFLTRAREAYRNNRFQEAHTLFRSSLELDDRLGRAAPAAEALEGLASIDAYAGRFDSALALYDAAAERHRAGADRDAVRLVTLQKAALLSLTGDERRAHGILTEALRLAVLFKEDEGADEIRRALVATSRALEQEEEESAHLDALLQRALASGSATVQARVYREIGLSALSRRERDRAVENLLKALTLAGRSRDSLLAIDVLYRLALVHSAASAVPQAFEAYTDALRRTDATRGAARLRYEMLIRVGTIYLRTGSPGEAARFYRPALTAAIAAGDRLAEGYLFVQLGHCEAATPAGRENAARNYRAALELFTASSAPRGAAYALAALGALAEQERRLTEALEFYRRSVDEDEHTIAPRDPDDVYEECERAFRDGRGPAAEDPLIELLLQLGQQDEAFWYVEQKQARALAGALGAMELRTGDAAADSLLERWRHARRLATGADRQSAALLSSGAAWHALAAGAAEAAMFARREMDEIAAVIVQQKPALASAVRPPRLTLSDIQRFIPRGGALVVYAPLARTLQTFVITAGGAAVEVSAPGRRQLTEQIGEFRRLLELRVSLEDSSDVVRRAADRRLLELSASLQSPFLRPLEATAGGAVELLVVLPEELGFVPLHALRRPGRGFLIEQSAVRYLPAASSLMLPAPAPSAARTVTGIGHSGSTAWDVEYELRDIRAFYREAALLFGTDATFEALKGAQGEILHCAAEFRYGARSAGNSAVLLSDGKSAGTTRAIPWGSLALLPPRGIVLLSDLGVHAPGKNGALAQLLLMGGTGSVGLHGYTPLRQSRKFFGEGFYTALLAGATPDRAFRQAQLDMIRGARPLHHWAAFSLWGK